MEDTASDAKPLSQISAPALNQFAAPLPQPKATKQPAGARPAFGCRHAPDAAVEFEVFKCREMAVEGTRFEHGARAFADPIRLGHGIETENGCATGGRLK